MNPIRTKAIIVRRTDYGEADRIMSLLTPELGKVSGIAKSVRKGKSRLAGGLELFSVCDVTLIKGRGEMYTLTSARIDKFYDHILSDYDRLQLGYRFIKEVSRAAENTPEPEFYELLRQSFIFLDDLEIELPITEAWFHLQLAAILGGALNVRTDKNNDKLSEDSSYDFDVRDMVFVSSERGQFTPDHIKVLRLLVVKNPKIVSHISGLGKLMPECLWVARQVSGFSN